jgi:tetratricopeptide (TPR) repeat protein
MGLGTVFEQTGQRSEMEDCYRKALSNRVYRSSDLTILARFCRDHGWLEAAMTNFTDAIKLAPWNQPLQQEALETLLRCGNQLILAGKTNDAANQFRQAVHISPDLTEPRLRLAVSLMGLGSNSEALAQFEEVLKRNSTNAVALEKVQGLRAKFDTD